MVIHNTKTNLSYLQLGKPIHYAVNRKLADYRWRLLRHYQKHITTILAALWHKPFMSSKTKTKIKFPTTDWQLTFCFYKVKKLWNKSGFLSVNNVFGYKNLHQKRVLQKPCRIPKSNSVTLNTTWKKRRLNNL